MADRAVSEFTLPAQGDASSAVLAAALRYRAAGLSLLPVLRGQKSPAVHLLPDDPETDQPTWMLWQYRQPTEDEIRGWFNQDSGCGIGIIGGAVSGNVVEYDVDHPEFCAWLMTKPQIFSLYWTVKTGSGKLHLYCRAPLPLSSTVIKQRGTKLVDVRSTGQYCVAPPSRHPSGGIYETLSGSYTDIPLHADPVALFDRIVASFLASPVGRALPQGGGKPSRKKPGDQQHAPLPPQRNGALTTDERKAMARAIADRGVNERIWKAIIFGAQAGDPGWEHCPSESEVDFQIYRELHRIGFTKDEARKVLQDWPGGDHTFRNPDKKGTAGDKYFETTWSSVVGENEREERRSGPYPGGDNFRVLDVTRSMTDPPTTWLTIEMLPPDGEPERIGYSTKAFMREEVFKEETYRQSKRLMPKFHHNKTTNEFFPFVEAIARMANLADAPDEAKGGYLGSLILQILKSRHLLDSKPNVYTAVSLGWKDVEGGRIYIRGFRLISLLGTYQRQAPTGAAVWESVRQMGGAFRTIALEDTSEKLWTLPLAVLE